MMTSASRKERYVDADTTWIYMEDAIKAYSKSNLGIFGSYNEVLYKSEEECFRIFMEERRENQLLNSACEKAEEFLDTRHTCDVYKIAKCAFTLEEPPLYRAFNNQTRNLLTIVDWEKFEFKGLWLLLHKAWRACIGQSQGSSMHVYRGAPVLFHANVGSVIKFKQFTSTSANRRVTLDFIGPSQQDSTLFDIKIEHGFSLADSSVYPGEEEILISPHEGLTVVDVKKDGSGMTTIFLEQRQQSLLF